MSKKTGTKTTKKRNFRLRKSVRRTLGTLFLISAIVVAAIPFPESAAADATAPGAGGDTSTFTPKAKLDFVYKTQADLTVNDGLDFGGANLNSATAMERALIIRQGTSGEYMLYKQFDFGEAKFDGQTRGYLAKYNDLYATETVELTENVYKEYYTVTVQGYEAFYTTGIGNQKETLNRTNSDSVAMFKEFYPEAYAEYEKAYETYLKELETWNTSGQTGQKPVEPTLEKTASTDMSEELKKKYYCYCDPNLKGLGYKLEYVNDKTSATADTSSTNTYIYVARGGTPPGNMTNDSMGFLVKSTSSIVAIGKGAFTDVSNVHYITLPQEIVYIADEAFKGSFIIKATLVGAKQLGNRAFADSTELTSVDLSSAEILGTEAFKGCTKLTTVNFPWSLKTMGAGAFAECTALNNVDLSVISATGATIGYGAFYNCGLGSLNIGKLSAVSLGEGAFATINPGADQLTQIDMSESKIADLKDYIFAGRTRLKTVVMPGEYGSTQKVTLLTNVFNRCANLEKVTFPEHCGMVEYEPDRDKANGVSSIFESVLNPEFVVEGPRVDNYGNVALERKSTWETRDANGNYVPYTYVMDGVTYYELKSSDYLITATVDKAAKEATITDCSLAPGVNPEDVKSGDLTLPDNVGPYKVVKLGDGCIDDKVKETLKNLTIGNSITEIGDQVFQNCTNLLTATIGDGVTSIGTEAFQGCTLLTKVTIGSGITRLKDRVFENCGSLIEIIFKTPAGGAASLPIENIGTDALATGSNKLTISGIIDEVYGPFVYSMNPDNYVNREMGIRICYKTPDPTRLTVILDNRNHLPTLVGYPKYEDLKEIEVDALDATGNPTGAKTNLLTKYTSGQALTPAEEGLINSTLYLDIPAGVKSIDAKGFVNSTSKQTVNTGQEVTNRYTVAAYFTEGANDTPEYKEVHKYLRKYKTAVEKYGLFNGPIDDPSSVQEKEVRGDDNLRSVTMHTVQYLPSLEEDQLDTTDPIMSGGAFYSCENLETVSLGRAMEDVGSLPFLGCEKLTSIASESPKYVCNNKILYENLSQTGENGTITSGKKIVECLYTRGASGDSLLDIETDPSLAEVVEIADGAFLRCENLGFVDLAGTPEQLKTLPLNCFRDCTALNMVDLPPNIRIIEDGAFENTGENISVYVRGKEVDIRNEAFKVNKAIVYTYKDTAAYNAALGIQELTKGLVTVRPLEDTYKVTFMSGVTGEVIKIEQVEEGGRAYPPEGEEIPKVSGMVFSGWSTDEYKNVTKDLIVLALYVSDGSLSGNTGPGGGGDGTISGNNGGGGTGGGGGNGSGGSGDYDANGNRLYNLTVTGGTGSGKYAAGTKVTINATGGASGTTFANWSSSNTGVIFDDSTKTTTTLVMPASDATVIANYVGQYRLEVEFGSGSGSYPAGAKVAISAVEPPAGKKFYRWTSTTTGLTIASSSSSSTTVTMPASNAKVTATYSNTTATGTGTTTGSGSVVTTASPSQNKTSIIITRPGISDTDQASAYVSGSSDGFIVKITESAEATQAALAALQREYSDMTPIRFAAMDISLYDSTGTRKITDTTGLKINITMPIPDELRTYAGNNKIAGIVNGSLDKLGVKFVTMNGVPCMSFTATHFSPYVVYVDTGNLAAGNVLDQTPKTGDGIHPKWFLSIGLASISMILFLKKDSKYKARLT